MGIDLSTFPINALRGKQLFLLNLCCYYVQSLVLYYSLIVSAVIVINNLKNVFLNLNRNMIISIFFENFCNIFYDSLTHCRLDFIAVRKIFICIFHLSFIFNYQYQLKNCPFDVKSFLVYFVGRYCNHNIIFSNCEFYSHIYKQRHFYYQFVFAIVYEYFGNIFEYRLCHNIWNIHEH